MSFNREKWRAAVEDLTWDSIHEASDVIFDLVERAYTEGRADGRDATYPALLESRGVSIPCRRCSGLGTRVYGSSSTWRGGAAGQVCTTDVCDSCWGSGDAGKKWPSHRALAAARGKT